MKINFTYLHRHECAEHQWSPQVPLKNKQTINLLYFLLCFSLLIKHITSNSTHIPSISFSFPWDTEHGKTLFQPLADPATGKPTFIQSYIEAKIPESVPSN